MSLAPASEHRFRLPAVTVSSMQPLWILVSGLCFAGMGVFVKLGSAQFSGVELVFYRSVIGFLMVGGTVLHRRLPLATPLWKLHISRSLIGLVGFVLYFFTIGALPLSLAVTLTHTAPLFVVPLSMILLKERPSLRQMAAISIGFCGVVLLLQPNLPAGKALALFVGLLVGIATAIGYINVRQMGSEREPEWRIVFYLTLVCTVATGAWLIVTGFHRITLDNVWIVLGVGVTSTAAQLAMTRAYRCGKTLLVTSLTYSNVVFATILAALVWGEVPPLTSWIAFAIIAASGVMASRAGRPRRAAPRRELSRQLATPALRPSRRSPQPPASRGKS